MKLFKHERRTSRKLEAVIGDVTAGVVPAVVRCDTDQRAVFETITPDIARRRLANMILNRTTDWSRVRQYAAAMAARRWAHNGETLQVGVSGKTLNGQHRYLACAESGQDFQAWVIYNVPEETITTMDTGKSRSAGDVLAMHGVGSSYTVAGAVRWLMKIGRGGAPMVNIEGVTNEDVLAWCDEHPDIQDSVRIAVGVNTLCPASVVAAVHWLFARTDRTAADQFVHDLRTGAIADERDPVLVARNRLIKMKQAKEKKNSVDVPALMINAWNARRAGARVTYLKTAVRDQEGRALIPPVSR
jgi:hypothetical protein